MKKFGLFLLITMLFISGCSEDEEASAEDEEEISPVEESVEDDTNTEESTEDEQKAWWEEEVEAYQLEDLPRELEELEQDLVLKEGMFSGDDYDFEEIKLLLDELPMDSSEEVLESAILQLIREDYHEEVEVFVKFDRQLMFKLKVQTKTWTDQNRRFPPAILPFYWMLVAV